MEPPRQGPAMNGERRRKLDAYLASVERKPFVWGSHDCALFAAACIEAQTGVDLAADVRGQYSSALSALRLLRKQGHRTYGDFMAARLPEIAPAMARAGDVVTVKASRRGDALAVCVGHDLKLPSASGTAILKLTDAIRAFRVG